jgi:predicted GIY-YIG superfamily endonuclease
MIEIHKSSGYWTKDRCIEESKKYKTRSEFREKNMGCYKKCHINGWDEAFEHMIIVGDIYRRCGYKMIYHDNMNNKYIYVGLTFNYEKRIDQHLYDKEDIVYRYVNKHNLIFEKSFMYHDYTNTKESKNNEINEIEYHKKEGIYTIININKGGSLGSMTSIWTYEKCK